MTTDRELLIWLHDRLVHVYKERELFGYMHRLRAIIADTPKNKISDVGRPFNGLDEILKYFEEKENNENNF